MTARFVRKGGDGTILWCLCIVPLISFPFIVIFILHWSYAADELLKNSNGTPDKRIMLKNDLLLLQEQTRFFELLLNMTSAPPGHRDSPSSVAPTEDSLKTRPEQTPLKIEFHGEDSQTSSHWSDSDDVVIVTPETETMEEKMVALSPNDNVVTGQDLLSAFFEQAVPENMAGKLNAHTWYGICGAYVEQLRHSPLFPRFPYTRKFLTEFKSQQEGTDFGQRIYGFVHPEQEGFHQFAITSDDTSELWLSLDSSPKKGRLIAAVYSPNGAAWTTPYSYKKYPIQISRKIALKTTRKYYIEALHKQSKGRSHIQVFWKEPGSSTFRIIQSKFLSLFVDDREMHDEGIIEDMDFQSYAPAGNPSHLKRQLDPRIEKFLYKC